MPTQSAVCPKIAIALGDPAGIGAEVVLKALGSLKPPANCEMTLFGNRRMLNQTFEHLMKSRDLSLSISSELAHPEILDLHEIALPASLSDAIKLGTGNAASGEASFRFLDTAIAQTLAGEFHAIVTAPIAKSAWKAAGHHYPGQTELLAEKAGVERFGMLFVARSPHTDWQLRTLLATTHIPLRQVADALSPDLLTLKLDLLVESLQYDFGIQQPRIAIAGLNPHSGEQGQLGTEERDWLSQWIQAMGDRHPAIHLDGPIPPDTLWVRPGQAWYGIAPSATHDAYLALYHDQGLIPVKLMAFDRAVNTTIGLPFIRTSPDHGTAFDIAGRGIADATSFKAALDLAVELVHQKGASGYRRLPNIL
ncbi:MAG: 4-hydroxythreonine-4-phosphate dehydrogenase PdxA [Elainellaceae cyanobacterium]